MNILIFSKHFWPESFRINELAEDLFRINGGVKVLTGKPNYPSGDIFPGYTASGFQCDMTNTGIPIYRVPMIPRGRGGIFRLLLNYVSFNLSALFFSPFLLRKEKIDVIFVYGTSPLIQGLSAIPLKWIFGAKLSVWVQDLWPEDLVTTGHVTNPFVLKINEWAARLLYYFCDQILIQAESFRAPVSRLAPPRKEILFLPNAAERDVFSNVGNFILPQSLEFLKSGFNIVFAGNIGNNQSIETIIEAAEILRNHDDIKIVLIGSGSRFDYLHAEITKRRLSNVIAPGRFASEVMPAIFHFSQGLLVSLAKKDSLSWTVPCKVQAYLAAGKPILASLDGEAACIVKESGGGLVSAAEDPVNLANNVLQLYSMSAEQRMSMGISGRRFAEYSYHPQKIARKLVNYFNTLKNKKSLG